MSLNSGDTAWLLMSTALVMLMSLPGLAIFYGGLAKRKDTLNTIAMTCLTYAIVTFLWYLYGYSFSFAGDISGIIGNTSKFFLKGIGVNSLSGSIPEYVFCAFQLTFAAITVALISGSYIERIKISSWVFFTILWFTLVYIPVAHWVWGGGFLAKMGVVDFAGGIVVHLTAGIAGLAGAIFLGKRKEPVLVPSNLTLVVIGTGLLWFGWFGFNAGSALASNGLAGVALFNTNLAAATAAIAWITVEWLVTKKPTVLGFASGAIAGLATITPAAGFVNPTFAAIIGILGGLASYIMVVSIKSKFGYDDALDVMGIHGISGIIGPLFTGLFADPSINSVAGLFYGNAKQFLIQLEGVAIVLIYDLIVTFIILAIVKVFTGLRVSEEEEILGLDKTQHGEKAYDIM
jgi:Amt family ammonium transporter